MNELEAYNSNTSRFYKIKLAQDDADSFCEILPDGFSLEAASDAETTNRYINQKEEEPLVKENRPIENGSRNNLGNEEPMKKSIKKYSEDKDNKFVSQPVINSLNNIKPKSEGTKRCFAFLQKIKAHDSAKLFLGNTKSRRQRSTVTSVECLDLSTIENKLANNEYKSTAQFGTDMRKIWNNAIKTSIKGSEIHSAGTDMSIIFEAEFKEFEHMVFETVAPTSEIDKKMEKLSKQIVDIHNIGGGAKYVGLKPVKPASLGIKAVSLEEKKALFQNIKKLPTEYLRGIWEIIVEGHVNISDDKEFLKFDVNTLPVNVIKDLENYVNYKMKFLKKSKRKSQRREKAQKNVKTKKENKHSEKRSKTKESLDDGAQEKISQKEKTPEEIKKNGENAEIVAQVVEEQQHNEEQNADVDKRKDKDVTSESSFISDSDSDSDFEDKPTKIVH